MSNKGMNDEQNPNNPAATDSGDGRTDSIRLVGEDGPVLPEADGDDAPWGFADGGYSEEFAAAEVETKKAVIRLADDAVKGEAAIAIARQEEDLVRRAKSLVRLGAINYPEEKPVQSGGMTIMQAVLCDRNFYEFYDAMFGTELPSRPHYDTFRGLPVDHNGMPLDDRVPIVSLVNAAGEAGLKGVRAIDIRRTYRDWIMDVRMNDLEYRFNNSVPEWDGQERLERLLIDLYQPFETPLNRRFGKYFWLSIYCRITSPGCFAPMVLSLFGGQNAGKSFMGKLISQAVMGDEKADSVLLDLGSDRNTFLRAITGTSVVANIGEMTGFGRGDMNKIKDFVTRTADLMDHKYERHVNQPRQWISMMDGNEYQGVQRDQTGNRRFYPMFVGQKKDRMGQPDWDLAYRTDYTGFKDKFWQVMAECRLWIDKFGMEGYNTFTRQVVEEVQAFSKNEMDNDRGTVRDDFLDIHFIPVMKKVRKVAYEGKKKSGIFVKISDINQEFDKRDRKNRVIVGHLKNKLVALGGVYDLVQNERGYMFEGYKKIEDFVKMLSVAKGEQDTERDEWKIVDIQAGSSEGDGKGDEGF